MELVCGPVNSSNRVAARVLSWLFCFFAGEFVQPGLACTTLVLKMYSILSSDKLTCRVDQMQFNIILSQQCLNVFWSQFFVHLDFLRTILPHWLEVHGSLVYTVISSESGYDDDCSLFPQSIYNRFTESSVKFFCSCNGLRLYLVWNWLQFSFDSFMHSIIWNRNQFWKPSLDMVSLVN